MTDDGLRSLLFSELLKKREDKELRDVIEGFSGPLDFEPIAELMISHSAWGHVKMLGVEPRMIFAHPSILMAHPKTSMYYRGIALLSQKRVQTSAKSSVAKWEDGTQTKNVNLDKARKVACLYNIMISSIIEGSSDWTLDNGYRNIIATMGITLDGMFRNKIGKAAEKVVKDRIVAWLDSHNIITSSEPDIGRYVLPKNTLMNYGSEPDIEFIRDQQPIATIEIKGGRDPAGALERLGAMTKSFSETPAGCVNFLVAGVITPEMNRRLNVMGNIKVYPLDDIAKDGEKWDKFTAEVFHYTIRVI